MHINTKFDVGEVVITPNDLEKLISDDQPLENIHFWKVSEIRVVQDENNKPCARYYLQLVNGRTDQDKCAFSFTDEELISIDKEFESFMINLRKVYDRVYAGKDLKKAPAAEETHDWVVPPYEKDENGDLVEIED